MIILLFRKIFNWQFKPTFLEWYYYVPNLLTFIIFVDGEIRPCPLRKGFCNTLYIYVSPSKKYCY